MKKSIAFLLILGACLTIQAQELNCVIAVNSPKNQNIDPLVFKNMENAMMDFVNGRKWTNDVYKESEKIRCAITINIMETPSEGEYKATAIIQSQRPVFNSNYHTLLLNVQDKTFDFAYADLQSLDYNDNGFTSQITSLLAYYSYLILAYDYESFGKDGGMPYFQRALTVCNNVPQAEKTRYKNWSPFDATIGFTTGTINRYAYVDAWMNPRYKNLSDAFYAYHLNGLDRMYQDAAVGRSMITMSLNMLQKIQQDNPNLTPLLSFFDAKSSELINIYSKADMSEKAIAVQLLSSIDPTNAEKYKQINKK
ncbi:MAG TPA: DUF4835 family protein [Chitinophagales bacterium]|nr:DUF4835 family protein [Chitinophagales bacterium]HNL83788.1 DUF4835 family protein [Chitinophagales bacterium]